jgi:acetyl-CoA synthetase
VANYLSALGVTRGDRVLVVLPNIRQLWEAMLALMKLRAVTIPATTLLTESDLADREAEQRGQDRRGPAEFWEEDFPEISRSTAH